MVFSINREVFTIGGWQTKVFVRRRRAARRPGDRGR
jgi:hypothetical protein